MSTFVEWELESKLAAAEAERDRLRSASPDFLRERGWTVAVHNDYLLNGVAMTFWLFTHRASGRFIKGEGGTDAEALASARLALALLDSPSTCGGQSAVTPDRCEIICVSFDGETDRQKDCNQPAIGRDGNGIPRCAQHMREFEEVERYDPAG